VQIQSKNTMPTEHAGKSKCKFNQKTPCQLSMQEKASANSMDKDHVDT
jgi:hypothetical protein